MAGARAMVSFDDLLQQLSQGRAYGLPGAVVERIITHAAVVFLVGDRAYKMKRPVRYSFLDFSTLARRRQALAAELRLNRRTAPMVYRRLLPLTRGPGGDLALDGGGEVVEWLLEMHRFDQADLLDRLAKTGALDGQTIDRLALVVAAFHQQAEPRPDLGGHAGMAIVIAGNAADLTGPAAGLFAREQVARLNERTRRALEGQRDRLEARRAAGHVRHCHGDLHLGNIVRLAGTPVLFDCLEFDDGLATIDTFYDLAFLLMDLEHRGLHPHATRLLAGYLDATWDDQGTALLPLFLSCRATIRAKVQGLRLAGERPTAARGAQLAEAEDYLRRALAYLRPAPPALLAIGGLSGTGKSTLARRLAPSLGAAPGAVVVRSDAIRKRLFAVDPLDPLPPEAYDQAVTGRVYAKLMERASALLAAGHGVIVDAVWLGAEERAAVEAVARAAGVPFQGIWLEAPAATAKSRVATRRHDPSDATAAVIDLQLGVDPGPITWTRIDAGGGPRTVAAAATARLTLPRRRLP